MTERVRGASSVRNLGLDLVRFAAVVLVIGTHLHLHVQVPFFPALWRRGGWVGVDLFFVLSGFLISGLLFDEHARSGRVRMTRFLIRRGFKIYPAFWLLLVYTVAYMTVLGKPLPWGALLAEAVFVQNYVTGVWNHTWSLAVEEHFYLGIALLFAALGARRVGAPFRPVPLLFVVAGIACLAGRIAVAAAGGGIGGVMHPTHLRVDSLMLGVALAFVVRRARVAERLRRVPSWLLLSGGAALLAPAFLCDAASCPVLIAAGLSVFAAGSGLIVLAASRLRRSDRLLLRAAGALGGASYSIYLWHMPVQDITRRFLGDMPLLYMAVYPSAAILAGYCMNRLVEQPALRLRDRMFPGAATVRDAGATAAPAG